MIEEDREKYLQKRLETSILQSCTQVKIRGARGEVYNGYDIKLIDSDYTLWNYQIKTNHRLAKFCASQVTS